MPETKHLAAERPVPEAVLGCCRAWVRHSPRRQTPCYLMPLTEDERWPAKVLNLATGGVGLRLEHLVEVGRFVLVELVSASGLFSRLLLTRVIHLSEHPEGGYILGGEFISELPAAELRFLLS
jgi:PilZ domain-containing protein